MLRDSGCEWYCVEMNRIEIRKQFRTFFVFSINLNRQQYTCGTRARTGQRTKIFPLVCDYLERCNALVPTYCLCVSIYCKWSLAVLCKQFTWVGNTLRYCALTLARTHNHKHFQKRASATHHTDLSLECAICFWRTYAIFIRIVCENGCWALPRCLRCVAVTFDVQIPFIQLTILYNMKRLLFLYRFLSLLWPLWIEQWWHCHRICCIDIYSISKSFRISLERHAEPQCLQWWRWMRSHGSSTRETSESMEGGESATEHRIQILSPLK